MTGPERETLTQALELQRVVLADLASFRSDIMHELRDFRDAIRREIIDLDDRLGEVEKDAVARSAEALGVSKLVDGLEIEKKERLTVHREWARIAVAAAGVGATAASVVWAVFEFFKAPLGG